MERRDLLKMIAAATGFAVIGGQAFAAGLTQAGVRKLQFSAADISLLDEIAETILPKTNTPGAKDAGCGRQMAIQVQDCYSSTEQGWFMAGLAKLQLRSQQQFQRNFSALNASEKLQLLSSLDQEAKSHNGVLAGNDSTNVSSKKAPDPKKPDATEPHFFTLFKQLTLFVFFTSKVGATEVLRYVAVPGKYDGDLPYKKGDRAWAT